MRPPALPEALLAAATPTHDYDIVTGDLHEEYLRISNVRGKAEANRWYWAQTLLSLPSLLSYSRSNTSALRRIGVAFIAFAVLVGMFVVLLLIDVAYQALFGSMDRSPKWTWIVVNYADAVAFGAILAHFVRTDVVRVAFFASLFLVLCFVIPAVAGHPGSQAPPAAWLYLLGAIPTMCTGAGAYQAIRRKTGHVN